MKLIIKIIVGILLVWILTGCEVKAQLYTRWDTITSSEYPVLDVCFGREYNKNDRKMYGGVDYGQGPGKCDTILDVFGYPLFLDNIMWRTYLYKAGWNHLNAIEGFRGYECTIIE